MDANQGKEPNLSNKTVIQTLANHADNGEKRAGPFSSRAKGNMFYQFYLPAQKPLSGTKRVPSERKLSLLLVITDIQPGLASSPDCCRRLFDLSTPEGDYIVYKITWKTELLYSRYPLKEDKLKFRFEVIGTLIALELKYYTGSFRTMRWGDLEIEGPTSMKELRSQRT